MDPTIVLGILCIATSLFGFGFIAGRNHARREARIVMALRERYRA